MRSVWDDEVKEDPCFAEASSVVGARDKGFGVIDRDKEGDREMEPVGVRDDLRDRECERSSANDGFLLRDGGGGCTSSPFADAHFFLT